MSISESKKLVLVLGADDNYARPLAVTVYSTLVHLHAGWAADLYIIDGGISAGNKQRIERTVAQTAVPTTIHWKSIEPGQIEDLPVTNDWINASSYLRLFIPDLLPASCTRALYLDSDLLIKKSLSALWEHPFDGTALCAVQDYFTPYVSSARGIEAYHAMGIPARTPYFNAGVMAIDLTYWREHRVRQAAIEYVTAHADVINFCDQEGLNAVVAGNWQALDPAWNMFVHPRMLKHVPPSAVRTQLLEPESALLDNPYIHHFAGSEKPWLLNTYHPIQWEWHQYLWRSGWYTSEEQLDSMQGFAPRYFWRWGTQTVREKTRPVRHRMARIIPKSLGRLINPSM